MYVTAVPELGRRDLGRLPPFTSTSSHIAVAENEESLKSVWRTLRKQRPWIIYFALGGVVLAVLACLLMTRQYQSTATIQVGKDLTVQVALAQKTGAPSLSESDTKTDIATHMAVLQDNETALAVIEDLNLESHRPFAFHPTLLGWMTGTNAKIEAERGRPLGDAPARRDRILKLFARKLEVKNPPDTRLITVAFLNPDPQLAAAVANTVIREYVRFESQDQASSEGVHVLAAQLDGLRTKMDYAQKNLVDYERDTGLNSLLLKSMGQGNGGGNITHIPVLDKLDALNQALTAAEANRIGKEAIYKLTRTRNSDIVADLSSSSLPAIASSAVVTQGNGLALLQNLRQQQGDLKLQYSASITKYGAKNPRILELESQLSAIDRQIREELAQIDLRARSDYKVARQNEDGLRAAFNNQEAAASNLNQSAVTLEVLAQEASSARQLYDGLNQEIQEANVQAGLRATNIRVIDPGRTHSTPKRPNPPVYVAIGLAAGLLFGISSAFVREHMDETVKTPLQVNPLTPLPVLASIPRMTRATSLPAGETSLRPTTSESSPLILGARSATSEAYRSLRASIIQVTAGHPLRTLVVTSPLIGEGKTSVSFHTAIAFANAGERVLMIDADLHRPRLHDYFGVGQSPGLLDVLGGNETLQSSIHVHSDISKLSLLPVGNPATMSAEILGSGKFDSLLNELKQTYSLIVIDTPPILLVSDAIVLSGKVDATLAVIRADMTNRTAAERMIEILELNGSRTIGLVLNAVDTTSVDYYHAFGHNGAAKYFEEN